MYPPSAPVFVPWTCWYNVPSWGRMDACVGGAVSRGGEGVCVRSKLGVGVWSVLCGAMSASVRAVDRVRARLLAVAVGGGCEGVCLRARGIAQAVVVHGTMHNPSCILLSVQWLHE